MSLSRARAARFRCAQSTNTLRYITEIECHSCVTHRTSIKLKIHAITPDASKEVMPAPHRAIQDHYTSLAPYSFVTLGQIDLAAKEVGCQGVE